MHNLLSIKNKGFKKLYLQYINKQRCLFYHYSLPIKDKQIVNIVVELHKRNNECSNLSIYIDKSFSSTIQNSNK